jgi:ubiquinol oxidase
MSDWFAKSMTKFFRFFADTFFAKRYGHRAVVLETVAGVPCMVAGMILHFKSLRKMKTGYGPDIREMLAEAENERMHLMFFIEIAQPNLFERLLVLLAQFIFMIFYAILYTVSYKTAHRMIAYFEEEAVKSYTEYLALVESG